MPPHTTKRTTTNIKTKNNQNCQTTQTAWKSDIQRVTEETFIHTGRRDRDGQLGGEDVRQGNGWRNGRQLEDQVVPNLHVDKLGGTTEELRSKTDHTPQGSRAGK